METKSSNQNDLLQQLKMLRAEKELLEKHVFVLNECLSVEELKTKISDLEKKKEMLVSLENLIVRIRAEIEPLQYLKSILENKIEIENQTNKKWSKSSTDLKSNIPNLDLNFFGASTDCTSVQSNDFQSISYTSNTNSLSKQKLSNEPINTIQTISKSSSNIISDGSIDECIQLLDQYDIVTDQELLNFSEENVLGKNTFFKQESATSNADNIDNKIQDRPTSSTYLDVETKNVQSQNDSSPTEDIESSVNINLVTHSTTVPDNEKSKVCEASTSKMIQIQDSLCSDSNTSINDLLLKLPHFLLQQGIDALVGEEGLNEALRYVSSKKEVNDRPDNQDGLDASKKETTDKNECEESNQCNKLSSTKNSGESINSFNDMNLKIDILRGIYSLGYTNPTNLQQRVIMHCINGRNVIVFTGPSHGRTLMFTIPLLQRIETNLNECQALVLVPNRDLAIHIKKSITSVGDFLGVNICIGGDNVPRKLSVVPHVVVGTPAGVKSMIACNSLRIGYIQTVVLNQVEKMLMPNFSKLIEEILGKLVKNKQVTLLTSDKLDHVLDTFMDILHDPLVIINDCEKENKDKILKNLPKQFYLNIQEEWKISALCEINETLKVKKAIVFCNTLDRAQKLYESLQRLGYAISLFNLEISAHEREQKLAMFSSDKIQMLITSDPIKGSQFQQANWIINYDLPLNPVCYLDRVAKCAENIKVLNLIDENNSSIKSAIETYNNSYMLQMPLNMIDLLQY